MKKLLLIVAILGLTVTPAAFAKKIGCGVKVNDNFKLNKRLVEGKQYKKERTVFGNSQQDFTIIPLGQSPIFGVRYEIEHYQVRAIIENLKNHEVQAYELGSISPRNAVSGVIFSHEFNFEIEPVHFVDEDGKPQVISHISGKCKLEKFYIGDLLPIP